MPLKTIVLTGSGSPLGMEICRWSPLQNYRVLAIYRDKNDRRNLTAMKNVIPIKCNLESSSELNTAIAEIRRITHKVDWLINSACGWFEGGIRKTPDHEIYNQILGTVAGTLILSKHLIPLLKARPSRIINVCSVVGSGYRFSSNSLYVTMKGAVAAFGRSIRNEFREQQILVTNLHLGKMDDGTGKYAGGIPMKDVTRILDLLDSLSPEASLDSVVLTPPSYEY